ncbi:unnamed protein product [Phytophthora fragariaefolia]|uniref:Unnamed protein product n=1 Tax=Phytophthora fragariaefolia TaxID=1490495 RepID=A0A9W6XZI2_9STRA|nr:unnamed protein product [Phytophthora fragariaefolia]
MHRSRHINPKSSSERTRAAFEISTPTTQAIDAPAARAADNTVVDSTLTTRSSSASTIFVVTATVTTSSSSKHTMSLGEYKKVRSKATLTHDELQAIFDDGSDADMEGGEGDEEASSPKRDEPDVGSSCPRKDDSDASSSKRSRSGQ